jgi:hypothetical protein
VAVTPSADHDLGVMIGGYFDGDLMITAIMSLVGPESAHGR